MNTPIRPKYCPRCDCLELIEKHTASVTQVRATISCPKCHWRMEGLSASQPSVKVSLVSTATKRGMDAHEALDQPMTRHYGPVDRVPLPYPVYGESV